MTSKERLPCPFCGDKDVRSHLKLANWSIECHSCSCEITHFGCEEDAWAAWNRRAGETTCSDGYKDAFYQIVELLGLTAMPISPKAAFETVMLPRLRDLVAAETGAPLSRDPVIQRGLSGLDGYSSQFGLWARAEFACRDARHVETSGPTWEELQGQCQAIWRTDVTLICTLPKGHMGDHRNGRFTFNGECDVRSAVKAEARFEPEDDRGPIAEGDARYYSPEKAEAQPETTTEPVTRDTRPCAVDGCPNDATWGYRRCVPHMRQLDAVKAEAQPETTVPYLDSVRLEWVFRNVSGAEWRRLGAVYSGNMNRTALNDAMAAAESAVKTGDKP